MSTHTLTDRTLILAADGRRARFFLEERRGAPLRERADWAMTLAEEDRYEAQDRPPRSFESVGAHRHGMEGESNLHDREEQNFLRRLAASVTEHADAFDALVLIAPPPALGRLRALLHGDVRRRVALEDAKDVVHETAAQLSQRLRDLRIP